MSKVVTPGIPGEMLDISFTMGFTDFASARGLPGGGQAAAGDPAGMQTGVGHEAEGHILRSDPGAMLRF